MGDVASEARRLRDHHGLSRCVARLRRVWWCGPGHDWRQLLLPAPAVLPQLEMLPDCLTKDRTGGLGSFGRGTPLWQFKGTVALGSRGGWREVSRSLRSRFLEKTGTHPATERRRRYLRRKPRARHQHSGADHRVRNADTAWWSHMLSGIRTRVIRGLGERDLVAPGSRRHCRGASSEHEATSGEASPFLDSPLRRPQ